MFYAAGMPYVMRGMIYSIVNLCVVTCPLAVSQSTILGVLEENPGIHYGDPNSRAVRIAFQKSGHEWQAFQSDCPDHDCGNTAEPNYPLEITWTIAFDGKKLGTVTSRAPGENRQFSRDQQQVVSSGPVPTIGTRTQEFMDASLYRPLIANSRPYFSDPDTWNTTGATQHLLAILRAAFRNQFPKLCRSSRNDDTKLEPFAYKDEDVSLVKAYSSRTGWVVARMHLEAIDCSDVEAGFNIEDPSFAVDPQNAVSLIGLGLVLVDGGDYDNDGKSELVFAINRDNRGGYELFYDNFKKRAVFEFGYH